MLPRSLLNTTCIFEQRAGTQSTTSGQMNYTWAAVYTSIRCRLDENTGREFTSQTGKSMRSTHVLFINALPGAITEADWRVDVGGLKYNILLIADAGGAGHHYELALERVK